jgi:hypothetical protein
MEIKNIYGAVLYTSPNTTIKETVGSAVKKGAYLRGADLQGADLQGAILRGAVLRGADLRGAVLWGADLQGADLQGADLQGAYLRGAYLQGADLQGADLRGAYLQGADLQGALNAAAALAQIQFIPETGSFEGWKKCCNGVIVRLLIPEHAKRSHGAERKCRSSEVVVLEVYGAKSGVSSYDARVVYKKGDTVLPDSFSENRWDVCAPGIHFFLTRVEAENYQL